MHKSFVSDTTNIIEPKLYMKIDWMVPYTIDIFYADQKTPLQSKVNHMTKTVESLTSRFL